MSCRTTRAGSASTTFARMNANQNGYISDVSTLSLFHQLRREWNETTQVPWLMEQVSPESYQRGIQALHSSVTSATELSEARRESLMERINAATNEELDPSTIYAVRKIVRQAEIVARNQQNFISMYAQELNISLQEAKERFAEIEQSIDRTRGARNPDTYTEENLHKAQQAGISKDAGAVHAFTIMNEEIVLANQTRYANRPPRVTHQPIHGDFTDNNISSSNTGMKIIRGGYDERNGHLEIVTQDRSGEQRTFYYRNVNSSTWTRMRTSENPTRDWENLLYGRSWNEYSTDADRIRASYAPHCPVCGQFSNNTHTCPVTAAPRVTTYSFRDYNTRTSGQKITIPYTTEEGQVRNLEYRVDLPLVNDFRTASREGAVILNSVNQSVYPPYPYYNTIGHGTLTGDLGISRDPETGNITVNTTELKCNCPEYQENYDCEHVRVYVQAIKTRLTPPQRTPASALTPEQRAERLAAAQARAEAAAASDWTRNEEMLAEARKLWQENSEVSYFNNFETFETHYREAVETMANKNGAISVPYMKENALSGMATRESGQSFGMEIEYEFKPEMTRAQREEANEAIGKALYEAKIFSTPTQQGYHAAGRNGYKDVHVDPETGKGTWSFEHDGSVSGGEIVSPQMYDEPQTWENLEKVVTILRENGAIPTEKAGAHVHVGTGFYQGDVAKYQELARMVNQHEDVMFRLAQNPERGTHRQGHYTLPLRNVPAEGWRDLSEIRRWQNGRTKIVNFSGLNSDDPSKDHPEFRIFDSTLNPGVMQAQIKLAVAMTHAAARAANVGEPTKRNKEQLGAHAERNKGKRKNSPMTSERLQAESTTFRSLMDTLFYREEDKKQFTSLFAATQWNKPDRANARAQRENY